MTIMRSVTDLNDLYYFARVVDSGSYTAAAKALDLQTSKLSRRVTRLEEELGVRLINRTTRHLSLTEAGQIFHRHCVALLQEAQAARDAIDHILARPQGLVRMSCPIGLLQGGLGALLGRFLGDYPEVRIALNATNRRVDVIEEGLDLAIRVRLPPIEDTELAMRQFGISEMILVATPDLVRTYGEPAAIGDMAGMPLLSMAAPDGRTMWRLTHLSGQKSELAIMPRLATDDLLTLKGAALDGLGAALIPAHLVAMEVEAGALTWLLPEWKTPGGVVHAVFPSRRGMIPSVRALLDYLVAGFALPKVGTSP
ncbi:Bacterial regulatory helix-turn-helix, lysR family protein (plasmid) [Neorhizobium galegae bv. officinalis bv. officinalis str. HAMBI 1141]|uniref:HTH-type transcriptional regulator TtuA n=2 Tax=Neorhizobium galegae TaxID=399 RepID=A0A068TK79_NEOGA|nr:Bacterial regulatory helix-turn-helix, lysR family protein [Neorhizobium galegae bv. officinalis bv. officinalis str. HAMBI 1141]